MRMDHAQWLKNVCVGEITKRLATDPLDDRAEQVISAIIVLKLCARHEVQSTLSRQHRCDCVVNTHTVFAWPRYSYQSERIPQPARMGEQVSDGNRLPGINPLREKLLHIVVQ